MVHHAKLLTKICGVRTAEEARATALAGADWIGLNFHPASVRAIGPEQAAEIVAALPETAEAVGLFVDRPPAEVRATAERAGLGIVQLHGDEPPEVLRELSSLRVVKAFRLGDAAAVERMKAYLRRTEELGAPPWAVLVDAYVPGQAGGTGTSIAGDLLDLVPRLPRVILAGGLTPRNLAERVARFRPWMVDVAGGVESSPGRKDPELVAAFILAARAI